MTGPNKQWRNQRRNFAVYMLLKFVSDRNNTSVLPGLFQKPVFSFNIETAKSLPVCSEAIEKSPVHGPLFTLP